MASSRKIIIITKEEEVPLSVNVLADYVDMYISKDYIGLSDNPNLCFIYPIELIGALVPFITNNKYTKYIIQPISEINEMFKPFIIEKGLNIYDSMLETNQPIYVRDLKRALYLVGRNTDDGVDLVNGILNEMSIYRTRMKKRPVYDNGQKFNTKRAYYMMLLNFFNVTLAENGPMTYRRLIEMYNKPQNPEIPIGAVLNYFIKTKTLLQNRETTMIYIPEQYFQ